MLSKIDLNEQQRDEVTLALVAAFNRNRHYFREEMEDQMRRCAEDCDPSYVSSIFESLVEEYLERVRGMLYMLSDVGVISWDEVRSMTSETLLYAQRQRRKYYVVFRQRKNKNFKLSKEG